MNFLQPGHLFLSQTLYESRWMPKPGLIEDLLRASRLSFFRLRTPNEQEDNIEDQNHRGDSNVQHGEHCRADPEVRTVHTSILPTFA
jgi:hypothetical protein